MGESIKNNEVIKVLKSVINSLEDSHKGFADLGEHLEDPQLKAFFLAESLKRSSFKGDLENELHRAGVHDVDETGTTAGAIHRAWGDLKAKVVSGDHELLVTAEQGEDVAKKAYADALEQPLRRGDFRGSARLRQQTSIPLMLDESIFTPGDALQAIREEACDLISIYPGKNGGILRSLEIAQMAANAGLKCVIGSNLEMDLGTTAMLHTAVAVPQLATSVDHDVIGPLYYEHHYTDAPIRYRNGCAVLPDGPGLGIEVELPEELDR